MLTHVLALALSHPRSIEAAGELTSRVAGGALAAGFLFRGLAGALAALPGAQASMTAAQFVPFLPTWWVPESAAGVVAWSMLLGLGLTSMLGARQLRRQLDAF